MFKRIALFIATNLAVILVLSIVLRLLGVDSILDEQQVGILGRVGQLVSVRVTQHVGHFCRVVLVHLATHCLDV